MAGGVTGLPLVCSGAVWSLVAGVWHASVDLWSPVLPLGCTCSEQQDKVIMRYKVWWNCMGKHPQNFPAESTVVRGDCWAMQDWNSWNSSQPFLLTYPNHQGNNTLDAKLGSLGATLSNLNRQFPSLRTAWFLAAEVCTGHSNVAISYRLPLIVISKSKPQPLTWTEGLTISYPQGYICLPFYSVCQRVPNNYRRKIFKQK